MLPLWVIRGYIGASGRDVFAEELRDQDKLVRVEFTAVLNGLVYQPIEWWIRPAGFDRLSGKYRELGKLRFKVKGVQHRPLGFFGPGMRVFTFVAWATERDGKFDPRDVRDTALDRMKTVKADTERCRALDYGYVR
jgi:hypothetical protein